MQIGSVQSGSLKLDFQPQKGSKGIRFDYYDPRDGNQDGLVSVAEERTYALKHPEVALLKQSGTPAGAGPRSSAPALVSTQASTPAYLDPADTNQDGFVSVIEEQAYALKHSEVEFLKRLRTPVESATQAYSFQDTAPVAGRTLDLMA